MIENIFDSVCFIDDYQTIADKNPESDITFGNLDISCELESKANQNVEC